MTENPAPQQADEQLIESICHQARALATALPGALGKVTLRAGEHSVEIEWHAGQAAAVPAVSSAAPADASVASVVAAEAEPAPGYTVAAPLVGTFYESPEPGADPFVGEGDLVEQGQEVAIIEAMKIMNRVVTEQAGRVAKILVGDGEMVEFGQALMVIEPADAG